MLFAFTSLVFTLLLAAPSHGALQTLQCDYWPTPTLENPLSVEVSNNEVFVSQEHIATIGVFREGANGDGEMVRELRLNNRFQLLAITFQPGTRWIWFSAIAGVVGRLDRDGDGTDAQAIDTAKTIGYVYSVHFMDASRLLMCGSGKVETINVDTGAVVDAFAVPDPNRVTYNAPHVYVADLTGAVYRSTWGSGVAQRIITFPQTGGVSVTTSSSGTKDIWVTARGSGVQSFSATSFAATSAFTGIDWARSFIHISSEPFHGDVIVSDNLSLVLIRCHKKTGGPILTTPATTAAATTRRPTTRAPTTTTTRRPTTRRPTTRRPTTRAPTSRRPTTRAPTVTTTTTKPPTTTTSTATANSAAVCEHNNESCAADVDGDGIVSIRDLSLVLVSYAQSEFPACADVNRDGIVNISDIAFVLKDYQKVCA